MERRRRRTGARLNWSEDHEASVNGRLDGHQEQVCEREMKAVTIPIIFILYCAPLHAKDYYVDPAGNDTHDCLTNVAPCLPIQNAVSKVPAATTSNTTLAPGIYILNNTGTSAAVNIAHFQDIRIHGPTDANGSCIDPVQVVVRMSVSDKIAFLAQDHSILGLSCIQIDSTADGLTAVALWQFAIGDLVDVRFSALSAGTILSVTEFSVANCAGQVRIEGGAAYFAQVTTSKLNLNCRINMSDGLAFSAFLVGSAKAGINAAQMVAPGVNMAGKQWILSDSTLIRPNLYSIPGIPPNTEQWAVIH
jgi:hypothetical protein